MFNAPYSNTRSVAELVLAEAILLLRGIPEKSAVAHRGGWLKSADNSYEIRGKTLGIVGYGSIGTQLSVLAEALLRFANPETSRLIMGSYESFLAMLNNAEQREALERLKFSESNHALFTEQRRQTQDFRDGLERLFFQANPRLTKLTQRYGVF